MYITQNYETQPSPINPSMQYYNNTPQYQYGYGQNYQATYQNPVPYYDTVLTGQPQPSPPLHNNPTYYYEQPPQPQPLPPPPNVRIRGVQHTNYPPPDPVLPGVIPEPPPSANVNTNIRMSICMCVLCTVTLILPAVVFAFIGLLCSLCAVHYKHKQFYPQAKNRGAVALCCSVVSLIVGIATVIAGIITAPIVAIVILAENLNYTTSTTYMN